MQKLGDYMAGKVTGLYLKGLHFWHKTWISVKLDVIRAVALSYKRNHTQSL